MEIIHSNIFKINKAEATVKRTPFLSLKYSNKGMRTRGTFVDKCVTKFWVISL